MNDELNEYLEDTKTQLDHVREQLKAISTGVFIIATAVVIAIIHFW